MSIILVHVSLTVISRAKRETLLSLYPWATEEMTTREAERQFGANRSRCIVFRCAFFLFFFSFQSHPLEVGCQL